MTDEVNSTQFANANVSNTVSTSQEVGPTTSVSSDNSSNATQDHSGTSEAEKPKRMYERDEVNRIAAHAAAAEREKVRAEMERAKQYSTPQNFNPQIQQQWQHGLDNNEPVTMQSIEATRQQLQQIAFEESLKAEADNLIQKIVAERDKYPDFNAVTDVMDEIVTSATAKVFNGYDNATDVIYHLGKNTEAIPPVLFELSKKPYDQRLIKMARVALDKIARQLKANDIAKQQPRAKDPIEHEKPSTLGMDSGKMSVSDLRRLKAFRG
jgi:uncharacterized protein YhaN